DNTPRLVAPHRSSSAAKQLQTALGVATKNTKSHKKELGQALGLVSVVLFSCVFVFLVANRISDHESGSASGDSVAHQTLTSSATSYCGFAARLPCGDGGVPRREGFEEVLQETGLGGKVQVQTAGQRLVAREQVELVTRFGQQTIY